MHFAAKVGILPWALGSVADLMGPPGALEGTIQKSLVKKFFFFTTSWECKPPGGHGGRKGVFVEYKNTNNEKKFGTTR